MTLRVRLLSLMLSMVAIVAITLITLNLDSLTVTSLDVAIQSSLYAGQQVNSFILRRLSESTPAGLSIEETKNHWRQVVADDANLSALLEQTMVQSRSIVEINISDEDGVIVNSSNPMQVWMHIAGKQDLHGLRETNPYSRIKTILASSEDYETRVLVGIKGQKKPVFTIQILVAPVLLREAIRQDLQFLALASTIAMILAFLLAYWSARTALRPLEHISHLIDDIVSGKAPHLLEGKTEVSRELVMIESKLNLLGERFRDARQDATQLRVNLEGALAKLDAGTRRHLENQLALARRLTAINSLTGRVAHEIKNPLNSIALRLEMLRAQVTDEVPELEPEFTILAEEVTRLDRVVRTFLDFNRPVEVALEDVDVADAAAEILHLMEPEAVQKGIEVSLHRPQEAVVVKADPDLLRQALLNIAVNAIEAMETGGQLAIEVEKSRDTCCIRIHDTGPGIPPQQRDKIFQLYYTTKPRGSGIGLAMTFRAVQLHGGTIEVEGEPGIGTTFRITLPLASEQSRVNQIA